MAKRRKTNSKGPGNGQPMHPFYDAWRTAYHDALYAEMLQAIEEEMKDPRRREIVRRFARELAATFTPVAGEEPRK
ncbi:MAG: hypothetical protein HY722_00425 [Planctomycetes bacterium]|nr:hypothetical protein [Planctomycetota bacterium]